MAFNLVSAEQIKAVNLDDPNLPEDGGSGMTIKVDTAANLTKENPILLKGQLGAESDTTYMKLGDGVTAWNDLEYIKANKSVQDAVGNVITDTYVPHCIDLGSVDLDTLKTGGLYTASNSENATAERHYPEPAHDGSLLVVGNAHGCTQTYTTYWDLNCYIRRYDAEVGMWSPWMGLSYVSDLDDKQDKLTFDATPTANSSNPVTSDGIKKYVDSALAALISADDKSY